MKVGKISNANTHFSGEVIVLIPRRISPNLETFHRLLSEERIQSLVKDAPFDLFIKENNKGKIDVYLKRTEDKEINPFTLLFIEEKISKVKDQMLMDKILEDMKRFEKEIFEKTEIKEPQPPKEKKFIPNKIGQNSQINNKSKLSQKFIKRR